MKKILQRPLSLLLVLSAALFGCTNDPADVGGGISEGALLDISVRFEPMSKLAELPSADSMSLDTFGLKNVGLYVYYAEDYEQGILENPYIRNMECKVENGKLVPVLAQGQDPTDGSIFIYDRMTVVAFYPYNASMSLPDNYFQSVADEKNYPITRDDYSQQLYIPYRAQTVTDPTRSFFTELTFVPVQTYKIEIVVVAEDTGLLPEGEVFVLPAIDPVDNDDLSSDGKRAVWFDQFLSENNGGGGSHIRRYTAYLWIKNDNGERNDIPKGEVLLQSDKLTLIASQDVTVGEDLVYRYGYNMTTGEIFIPTSSFLVHDVPTLLAVDQMSRGSAYQVCDIDLSGAGAWQPIALFSSRYDGGGHRILNLNISNSTTRESGLFSHVKGNTTVCNVNLVDPVITVDNPTDTVYVGAICGRLNSPLTEAEKQALLDGLPPNLSQVVKEALLKDLLEEALSNTSDLVACRVENPTITVNALVPYVGTICGLAGDQDDLGSYKSMIWDSYSLGGSIAVNVGNEANNAGGYTGGFCGLNNGLITRSYTTVSDIVFQVPVTGSDGTPVPTDAFEGFTTVGTVLSDASVTDCFAMEADSHAGVSRIGETAFDFPTYTDKWPVLTLGWMESPGTSFWYSLGSPPASYPILQYERR